MIPSQRSRPSRDKLRAMSLQLFATVFGIIFVAELPDKTALAALVLAMLGVELLGAIAGGSQRWLDLGPLRLQP